MTVNTLIGFKKGNEAHEPAKGLPFPLCYQWDGDTINATKTHLDNRVLKKISVMKAVQKPEYQLRSFRINDFNLFRFLEGKRFMYDLQRQFVANLEQKT